MSITLLHQLGHNNNWNFDAHQEAGIGDGFILSPVHQDMERVEKLDGAVKGISIFDPQFYLPSSSKKKLQSYPFFPDNLAGTTGFQTVDFSAHSSSCAQLCLKFQLDQGFSRIIIPARYFDQLDPDYIEKQESFCVLAFIEEIKKSAIEKPVYLTLPMTSHMIMNESYRTTLLNWATSFQEIDGIYLIVQHERRTKQIQDAEFLFQHMIFVKELKDAELDVIISYQNTESLLFTVLGQCTITMGSFENTRMFSVDKFMESDDERRGPHARIYLPGLLNWVQYRQAKQIEQELPELWHKIYMPTTEGDSALAALTEPTFNQPQLYKHYFRSFQHQINSLRPLPPTGRYELLRRWIKDAQDAYESLESNYMMLEKHASGDHLDPWLDALNRFFRKALKQSS